MKNLLTTLLFFLLIKIVAAQSVSTTNDSIKPLDNSTTGTWLKIMYSTKGAPFTAKEIIYIKGNSIIIYNGKVIKNQFSLQPFTTMYQYTVQCCCIPCPKKKEIVTMYYSNKLKGSLKVKKDEYYFVEMYPIKPASKKTSSGNFMWTFKAKKIIEPTKLKNTHS